MLLLLGVLLGLLAGEQSSIGNRRSVGDHEKHSGNEVQLVTSALVVTIRTTKRRLIVEGSDDVVAIFNGR